MLVGVGILSHPPPMADGVAEARGRRRRGAGGGDGGGGGGGEGERERSGVVAGHPHCR